MDRRHAAVLAVVLLTLLAAPGALQATEVTGQVTADGEPLADVTVIVGDEEARTGADGRYAVDPVPEGPQTLIVFKPGFRTVTRVVTVPASGSITEDFALEEDLLYADTLVVTGTRSPQTKKESSVAITTMTDDQIDERQPRNTADLMKAVPGFYVESSGGEVGGNLWARGLPADGSYRYVALMEDGMPVYDSTELFFVNADIFVRVDQNIAELEAVRGGNAALYGSNAPGGVINFLSKTGGNVPETDLKLVSGTDGLFRFGFNTNGPLTEDWTYSVGGFYRYDEGVRDPGYPASQGGQIKANLTRNFERGFFRTYFKHLDDSNTFFLPLPFRAGDDPEFVEGFPFDGTLHTPELNHVRVPRPNDEGLMEMPLDDGQKQELTSIAAELYWELPEGWVLSNTARFMTIDHTWNAVVPFDLVSPADFAAGFVGPGDAFSYSFTNGDQPFSTENDLLLTAGLWNVQKPMESFANQLQLSKGFATGGVEHQFTVGAYAAHYEADNRWLFTDVLTEVSDTPRLVDLTVFEADGGVTRVTDRGFRSFGSLFVNGTGNVDVLALYAGDEIKLNDQWRLDLGLRLEHDQYRQTTENTGSFELGDPTTLADDSVAGGLGSVTVGEDDFDEWAFSVGVNYLLNENVALWGRASRGYKMPILDNFLFDPNADLEAEEIFQYEVGTKIGTPRWGLNTSVYFLEISDFPSQDARVDPVTGETEFVTAFVGEAETVGVETELVTEPIDNLRIDLGLTYQEPEYTDFIEGQENFSGNQIRRIPEVIWNLLVSYDWGPFGIDGTWNYFDDRFSNNANTIVLPEFDVVGFSASWDFLDNAELELGVVNAFNSKGLTEGNPRLDESAQAAGLVFLARPVLPRRTTLSISFDF